MTNPITKILDLSTNQEVEREMNSDELAAYKIAQEIVQSETKIAEQKATEKAALLAKLGITEDEARLLLG